jgi:ribonucleoside-diphosphate reductase alpha chain
MMAAAQPFISGAISKTINLPNEATVEDIAACYRLSWELGLKANALYRDGCKLSQPLSATSDSDKSDEAEVKKQEAAAKKDASLAPAPGGGGATTADAIPAAATPAPALAESGAIVPAVLVEPRLVTVERVVEKVVERPMRRRLTDTRASITHKFNIAGHEGYLTVGLYDDGMPGELFITMAKEGSTIGGLMDSLGTAVSVALQYGVPIESLVNKFTHQRFEPAGMTTNREIPIAKSLVDYIFRWMGMEFIPGYREANAPKRGRPTEPAGEIEDASAPRSGRATGPGEGESRNNPVGGSPTAHQSHPVMEDAHPWKNNSVSAAATAAVSLAPATTHPQVRTVGESAARADTPVTTAGTIPVAVVEAHRHVHQETVASNGSSVRTVVHDRSTHLVARGAGTSGLNAAMRNSQEDAPACDVCGTITVRSGTCYKCLNCGASMGCS